MVLLPRQIHSNLCGLFPLVSQPPLTTAIEVRANLMSSCNDRHQLDLVYRLPHGPPPYQQDPSIRLGADSRIGGHTDVDELRTVQIILKVSFGSLPPF